MVLWSGQADAGSSSLGPSSCAGGSTETIGGRGLGEDELVDGIGVEDEAWPRQKKDRWNPTEHVARGCGNEN